VSHAPTLTAEERRAAEVVGLDAAHVDALKTHDPAGWTSIVARHGLTAAEREAAERAGMTPERYGALKDVGSIEDWQRLQARSSSSGTGAA